MHSLALPRLTVNSVFDILLVAVLIYELMMVVRRTRAAHILGGILILALLYAIAVWGELETLRTILAGIVPYTVLAVIVLFQSEIRRALARIGRHRLFSRGFGRTERFEELVMAMAQFSLEKTGALIVLERDVGLRTFIESGVPLDAYLSKDLLLAIFAPAGALHDGAAIVQKDRIAAARCFLPLSLNPAFSTALGTRHRAAVGITEETDCLSLVVSEQTGRISIAAFGEIQYDVTMEHVKERIAAHFAAKPSPGPGSEGTRSTAAEHVPDIQKVGGP